VKFFSILGVIGMIGLMGCGGQDMSSRKVATQEPATHSPKFTRDTGFINAEEAREFS
jgi:hypothetical protein